MTYAEQLEAMRPPCGFCILADGTILLSNRPETYTAEMVVDAYEAWRKMKANGLVRETRPEFLESALMQPDRAELVLLDRRLALILLVAKSINSLACASCMALALGSEMMKPLALLLMGCVPAEATGRWRQNLLNVVSPASLYIRNSTCLCTPSVTWSWMQRS
ncbi:unnamed protein product [Durusdinium trenchii]|uniref:Uncharacterized protein n=1 Tax=Durusdinium trenchii TaxID=1381693 RepID=A0ABP0MDB2_9DINO